MLIRLLAENRDWNVALVEHVNQGEGTTAHRSLGDGPGDRGMAAVRGVNAHHYGPVGRCPTGVRKPVQLAVECQCHERPPSVVNLFH
jgi:hypothetical protein